MTHYRFDHGRGDPVGTRLCRHDSTFDDQDAHPHPKMTPADRSVTFTSSRGNACNVYEVLL